MKANIIVITFILVLIGFAYAVSSNAMLANSDKVNSQQLELHKSVLARKELETLVKYNKVDLDVMDVDVEMEPEIEVAIKAGDSQLEAMVIDKGTVVNWINEALQVNTITLENEKGEKVEEFGENVLRAGDRFYHKFDSPANWVMVTSNASGKSKCTISVVE